MRWMALLLKGVTTIAFLICINNGVLTVRNTPLPMFFIYAAVGIAFWLLYFSEEDHGQDTDHSL